MALTDFQIKNLKYTGKPMKVADGGGLYLYLSASGKKLWRLGYYFERRARVLSFGEYPVVTLQKAREKRQEAKQLLADGIDPGAKRKIAKEEQISEVKDMFRNIAQEWFEARTTDFTEKHRGTVAANFSWQYFSAPAPGASPPTRYGWRRARLLPDL